MSLQRSTETCRAALILLLLFALLAMGGCADLGLTKSPTAGRPSPGPATTGANRGMLRSIPSDALTMFERATAAMAAGDFVEAEFGFKELVLLYPNIRVFSLTSRSFTRIMTMTRRRGLRLTQHWRWMPNILPL